MSKIKYYYKILIYILLCFINYTNAQFDKSNSILLNAEPFGFGPASIISQISASLKSHSIDLGYIGEGFTLDLQQPSNYQEIIKLPSQAQEETIRTKLRELRKKYSYFFTISDFNYARIAQEEGYTVGAFDSLTWHWRKMPDVFANLELYIAQNFVGVEQRLRQLEKKPQQIHIVPAVTPKLNNKSHIKDKINSQQVFINLGGLQNPFIKNKNLAHFVKIISNNLLEDLSKTFNKYKFATSKKFIADIPILLNPSTLTFTEVIKNLQNSTINLMTPGLGNIFEAASCNAPVIWLMPMNDSQGQQLKLLESNNLVDWFIDWHDVTGDPPIDYFQSKQDVMQQINKNITNFINRAEYQNNFKKALQKKLLQANIHLKNNQRLNLAQVIDKFGNNGMSKITSIILEWSKNIEPAFSSCWLVGGDIKIKFESDVNFTWDNNNTIEFKAHIPGFELCNQQDISADFTIKHKFTNSNAINITQEDNVLTIYTNWQDKLPADFLHMLYGICRKLWLEKNIYPVHAALVRTNAQDYTLIAGPSGSGKTSVALSLFQQGYSIFSGDKTLIKINNKGEMYAIAGTKTITIRKQDEARWKNIKYDKSFNNGDRILAKIDTDNNDYARIKSIYLITINDGVYYNQTIAKPSALHTLYPLFLDKQREDVLIGEDKAVLNGNINSSIKKQLAAKLKYALDKINVYKAIGDRIQLVKIIQNNHNIKQQQTNSITSKKKILFGVCGIGNGHINRQLPLLKHLLQSGHEIIIFTYGQGLTGFNKLLVEHNNLKLMEVANPYITGNKYGLDFLNSIDYNADLSTNFFAKNYNAMNQALQNFGKPDLVISDYEAISAQYAYAKNCDLITIDQQSKYLIGNFPQELNETSYIDEIERLSMFFPVAKQRIALSFFQVADKQSTSNKKVTILPPILRPEIIKAKNQPVTDYPSLLVYISSQQMCNYSVKDWADILENNLPKTFTAHFFIPKNQQLPKGYKNIIFYYQGDSNFNKILYSCHGIISTAGHSLLSEAMYLEKPVYAIPISLYEQQLNARIIDLGGFGINHEQLSAEQLKIFTENLAMYKKNIQIDTRLLLKSKKQPQLITLIDNILHSYDVTCSRP